MNVEKILIIALIALPVLIGILTMGNALMETMNEREEGVTTSSDDLWNAGEQ